MSGKPLGPDVRRDCQCPKSRHQHGTRNAYIQDRCRCRPCRDASAEYANRRYRRRGYGTWAPELIDNTGTRRRIHALMTLGWDIHLIARRVGIRHGSQLVHAIEPGAVKISRVTAERVAAVYDELWNKPRVGATKGERIAVDAVPLAWDDDTIDDPAARPFRARPRLAVAA